MRLVYISVLLAFIFFASAYIGYTSAKENLDLFKGYLEKFFSGFEFLKGYRSEVLVLIIFLNNAIKSLVFMLAGFFFGIAPILFIATNGFLLGIVLAVKEVDFGFFRVLSFVVPHGIFEIPAVILASAQGVLLGYRFYESLFKGKEFKRHVKDSVVFYLKYVIPILLIAAFMEVYVTPLVASLI